MSDNVSFEQAKHGVLGIEYAEQRTQKKALKYRLWRRTHEVRQAIDTQLGEKPKAIIDLGTAEGRMLDDLSRAYPGCECVGIEYNPELVALSRRLFPHLDVREGDVQDLSEISVGTFDVAVATAVIEHLENPRKFLRQVKRLLKPSGLLVMTAPDPFWEHVATMVGHLADEQHHEVPDIRRMCEWLTDENYKVLTARKFMLSPMGMPFEFTIEKIVRRLGMSFLMANQLVVART